MKGFGLPVLAREDGEVFAVFSGQIIVPRDPAFYTTVLMKKPTSRLVKFVLVAKIAKRKYSVCKIFYCAHAR